MVVDWWWVGVGLRMDSDSSGFVSDLIDGLLSNCSVIMLCGIVAIKVGFCLL